jgi:hypothetical protein
MIIYKGCHAFLCGTGKEGKRANYRREREGKCVRGRASEEREMGLVERLTFA